MNRTAYKNQHCREHYDRVYLTIPKGEKDRIKATAADLGMSVNKYLYALVCDDLAAGESRLGGSGGNEALREKLIDVIYENEQLKAENSKLRETLNKAYDFMQQFVMDGRNLLERFLESVRQMVEKVRSGLRR